MSPVKVKSFLTLKDKLVKMLLSGLVYKYKCGGCNAIIMVRLSDISKSEFVNNETFHISLQKGQD